MTCNFFTSRHLRCPKPVLYGGILAVVVLSIAFLAIAPRWNTATIPSGINANAPLILLEDLNTHRRAAGLTPLQLQPTLALVARKHAVDMVERNYFDHISPNGMTPFQRMHQAHVHFVWAGENIAESDRVDDAAQALWQSPEHRANIMNPHYRRVGISARQRPDGAVVFVEEFSN